MASLSRSGDRPFMLAGLAALLALAGFVAYVVVSGAGTSRDGGAPPATAAGDAPATFPDPAPPSLALGASAPAFTLPSVVPGGAPVRLSAERGEPAIVGFFASWCANCKADLAAFATVARREAGHVAVVGVDTNDGSGAAARPLLRAAGTAYPVGLDPEGTVATRYRLVALPTTYFLDASGRVAGVAFGPQSTASLAAWVARLTGAGSS